MHNWLLVTDTWGWNSRRRGWACSTRLRLAFDPALAFKVLAVRAASMSAGMRRQALLAALGQHLGAEAAAAGLHGPEGFELAGQQLVLVLRYRGIGVLGQELGLEAGDDAGQRDGRR